MPDRIVRDELWESDRFLDLPSDTHRLAFIRFLHLADDFGNFEGGQRRLFRLLHAGLQVKTQEAATGIIMAMIECDLLRRYEIDGREFFHIPRFGQHRSYKVRIVPASEWDKNLPLGKHEREVKQGLAKNLTVTQPLRDGHVFTGVEVGVGVGVGKNKPHSSEPNAKTRVRSEPVIGEGDVVAILPSRRGPVEVRKSFVRELIEAYPDVMVATEIDRAKLWLDANPTKHKANVRRFLTNWISRKQEGGGTR